MFGAKSIVSLGGGAFGKTGERGLHARHDGARLVLQENEHRDDDRDARERRRSLRGIGRTHQGGHDRDAAARASKHGERPQHRSGDAAELLDVADDAERDRREDERETRQRADPEREGQGFNHGERSLEHPVTFCRGRFVDPLRCAIETATEAGALLLQLLGTELETREKGTRGDLVTAADRASEEAIVTRLRGEFPSSSILGEEGTNVAGTSDERWILDPLDGTTNFAHGYPLFCVSIGFERAGEMICGVICAPALGELYVAERGGGARCNERALSVSHTERVAEALVCTGFKPARYERNGANFAKLSGVAQGVRRDGSAALDLAFVAGGRFDAFWELDLSPWDVAAGALIVREAGGLVTSLDGSPFDLARGSTLASNARVHAEMVSALTST